MSFLPAHSLTEGKRPFWRLPLALLLYSLVVLAGVAPSVRADLPDRPLLTPKVDRFVVAGPKGDSLTAVTRNSDSSADGADPDDQPWPPQLAEVVDSIIAIAPLTPAMVLQPQSNPRYLLQPSRAPPSASA